MSNLLNFLQKQQEKRLQSKEVQQVVPESLIASQQFSFVQQHVDIEPDNKEDENELELKPYIQKSIVIEEESQIFDFYSDNNDNQDDDDEENNLQPRIDEMGKNMVENIRDYQKEIFMNSFKQNSLVYLETGTGKTLVATMLIYYYFKKQRKVEKKKKIIFVANTVQLIEQQYAEIKQRLKLVSEKMENDPEIKQVLQFDDGHNYKREFRKEHITKAHGHFKGKENLKSAERFTKSKWESIKSFEIIIMMGQVLLNGLRRGYIHVDEIEVIIFDECHHTRGDHPYNLIMYEFYHFYKMRNQKKGKENEQRQLPKIYGLTASPVLDVQVQCGTNVLDQKIQEICSNLDSQFAPYDIQKAKQFIKETNISVETYEEQSAVEYRANQVLQQKILNEKLISLFEEGGDNYAQLLKFYKRFKEFKEQFQNQPDFADMNKQILSELEKIICCDSLQVDAQLGKYAVSLFFSDVNTELQKTKSFQHNQQAMERLQILFDEETKEFARLYKIKDEQNVSLKFRYLFGQLKSVMESDRKMFYEYKQQINYGKKRFLQNEVKTVMEQYVKQKQSMILIFVQEKIIIKYLRQVLQHWIEDHNEKEQQVEQFSKLFRYNKVVCLTGQSNYYEQKKKNFWDNIYKSSNFSNYEDFQIAQVQYERFNQKIDYNDDDENSKYDDLDKLKIQIGDHQQSSQKLTLVTYDFEVQKQTENIEAKKDLQIILSTSVTEEGFDIPSCNLVISFNQIANLKSFVQIKGRARKENSKFLIMAKDLEQKIMYEQNNKMYQDLIKQIKDRAPLIQKKDVEIRKDYRYKIEKTTSAILNTNWAVMLFHSYANYLHYDIDQNIRGPFFYFIETINVGYICQIILPPSASSERRLYCSRPQKTKEQAKKDACFQAVIILKRQYKIFDEHLRTLQQVINQKQNVFHEAIYEDKNDSDLVKILNKYTVNEVDLKQKYKKTYFDSIMGQALKANFFYQSLEEMNLVQIEIYLLQFSNSQKKMPDIGFGFSKNFESEIGFIHSTKNPIKQNIRYFLQLRQDQIYADMILQKIKIISLDEYQRLMKINRYLNSVALSKDIEFFAELTQNEMNPNGKLFKDKKKIDNLYYDYKFDNSSSFSAFITLLKPSEHIQGTYDINEEHLQKIESYIKYMSDVYKIRNRTKLSDEEKRSRKEKARNQEKNDQIEEKIDFFEDQKVNPDYECVNFFNDKNNTNEQEYINAKEKLVLQNITQGKHFNRFIFLGCKKIGQIKKELANNFEALQKWQKQKNVTEVEEVKFKVFDDHMGLKVQLFDKKYLRKNVNHYLSRNNFLQEDESKNIEFKHFPNQYTIFPMNVSLLMKLKIFHLSLFYQIRDSFAVHHFQQIRIPKILKNGYNKIVSKEPSYQFEQKNHFICDNYLDLIQIMRKDEKYYKIALRYQEIDFSQKLDIINPNKFNKSIHEEYEQYQKSAQNIKLIELTKSITSSEYSPNQDKANLERYEFLGDTVLKCLSSLEIYFTHPTRMEKYLHVFRTQIIFNRNLSKIAIKNKLFKYILANKLDHCQPLGIIFEAIKQNEIEEDNDNKNENKQNNQVLDEYDLVDMRDKQNKLQDQDNFQQPVYTKVKCKPFSRQIKGKTHADCLESLVGVFYWENRDLNMCQFLLNSLKVLTKPDLTFEHVFQQNLRQSQLKNPIFHHLRKVEDKLNYRFHNINLLFQAFTLPEFDKICSQAPNGLSNTIKVLMKVEQEVQKNELNQILEEANVKGVVNPEDRDESYPEALKGYNLSNQRLEFLGDAVLDLIVVEYLFEKHQSADPGLLTTMKTQVVQNRALCLANLDNGFYEYIIGNIQKNEQDINNLLESKDEFQKDISLMYNEKYNQSLIKTLGDVIESLVCAIFIDTNLNYEKTKEIILSFMKKYIDQFTSTNNLLNNVVQLQVAKVIKKEFGDNVNLDKDANDVLEGKIKFYISKSDEKDNRLIETYAFDEIDALDKIYNEIDFNRKSKKKN